MTINEILSNYTESFDFLYPRKQRQVAQLVLLNNLQRGDENISSTLLLTLFQRILSNAYDDKMQVKFVPGEELDQKKVATLNLLAQNDYREMDKARLDYDWIWDTLFFGRGYCETLQFDKKRKLLKPSILNPLSFGYDPYFENPQQWRYYWKWLTKSKWEVLKLIKDKVIDGISDPKEIASGVDPYLWDFKIKRDAAKKAQATSTDTFGNDVYQILEYYGHDDDGDRCVYWLDKDLSHVLMKEKLDLRDNEDGTSKWPIVVKEAFREPHSSVIFSIADLLEDKHRAKSVLLNLAYIAAKDKANPIYGYNPDKIKDINQFFSRQINQHIPMDDQTAAWPLNTQEPMSAGLIQFIAMLTQEANDPVGTGGTGSPVKKGKSTAAEAAIQQQMNDLAQSLQSKVMQFGEQEFWSHWYQRYKRHSKAGDEKIATIIGVKGMTFEKIDLGEIYTKYPPGVLVFSAKEAEYKELVLRRDLMQLYPQLQESLDAEGMRNFNKFVFFPKFLSDPTLIDVMMPKSIDEMKAEDENDQLAKNVLADVSETDDHQQHIYVHKMAKKTWATWNHMAWHEELLALQLKQKHQQELQKAQQGGGSDGKPPGPDQKQQKPPDKPKPGVDKQNPDKAAVPLAGEMKQKTKIKK